MVTELSQALTLDEQAQLQERLMLLLASALLGGTLEKSAAVGLFQSLVGLVLVVGTNQIVRKVSPENSMF